MIAYDASHGRQTTALGFIVNRPADEPGFRLERIEEHDRVDGLQASRLRRPTQPVGIAATAALVRATVGGDD